MSAMPHYVAVRIDNDSFGRSYDIYDSFMIVLRSW